MLTDTHCHLYYKDLKKDLQGVFDRANKLGVNRFICAATNMEDVHQCIEIAENYDQVFCSSGIHCLLYTSPIPRDRTRARMTSSA